MHEVFSPETGAPLDGAVGAADQGCGESLTTWLAAPWCGSWQQALGSPLLHAPDLRDAWPDSSAIGASSWATLAIRAWRVFQGNEVPRMGRLPREAVEADEDHP